MTRRKTTKKTTKKTTAKKTTAKKPAAPAKPAPSSDVGALLKRGYHGVDVPGHRWTDTGWQPE